MNKNFQEKIILVNIYKKHTTHTHTHTQKWNIKKKTGKII